MDPIPILPTQWTQTSSYLTVENSKKLKVFFLHLFLYTFTDKNKFTGGGGSGEVTL